MISSLEPLSIGLINRSHANLKTVILLVCVSLRVILRYFYCLRVTLGENAVLESVNSNGALDAVVSRACQSVREPYFLLCVNAWFRLRGYDYVNEYPRQVSPSRHHLL
jgi:hypothetical protein